MSLNVQINGQSVPNSNLPPSLRVIAPSPLRAAIQKYDRACIPVKCLKNQNNERFIFLQLRDYLEAEGIVSITDVNQYHLEAFRAHLAKRMKNSSVNRRFSPIKNFFGKCVEWGLRYDNPARLKDLPEEDNPFKPWPVDIYCQFMLYTDDIYPYLFAFIYETGCRPIEARNFVWSDVDEYLGFITLRCGKNKQTARLFPITPELTQILRAMRRARMSPYVFTIDGEPINTGSLYHYCKDRLYMINGGEEYTVYGMRHAFGTDLNAASVKSFTLASLMGHKKLETTRQYTKIEKKLLLQALSLR